MAIMVNRGVFLFLNRFLLVILAGTCFLFLHSPVFAERKIDPGIQEMRKDLSAMIAEAEKGDPKEQFFLGILYSLGIEGKRNYRTAFKWFEKAAAQRMPEAKMAVVIYTLEGIGTKQDFRKAYRMAEKMVDDDNPWVFAILGMLTEAGAGVKQDNAKAASLYKRAEDAVQTMGERYQLGMMYLEGRGVKQDTKEAIGYLNQAARKDDPHASYQLGMMYFDGKGVDQDLQKAFGLFNDATAVKSPGMFSEMVIEMLGPAYYLEGVGYTRTMAKLMKRDPLVRAKAYTMMGHMAEEGLGVPKDTEKARSYYKKAVKKGDTTAQAYLDRLPSVDVEDEEEEDGAEEDDDV